MESNRRGKAHLMSFLLAGLVFQTVITPVVSRSLKEFSDQKNYYTPHSRTLQYPDTEPTSCSTPSNGGSSTPSHGAGSGYGLQTQSQGSGCSYGSSSPSQGGGGSYGTQAPLHESTGYYNPPPSSGGLPAIIPSTPPPIVESPVTPPGSSGGYNTPTPSHGSGGYYKKPPSSPKNDPPVTKPLIPDPNIRPHSIGTCKYWKTHPEAILSALEYLGNNISQLFGAAWGLAFGRNLSLPEALANTRTDGIGALYREGSASLLNSVVDRRFPYTTQQVKDAFVAAITSVEAAAKQAELFKQANEGRPKF